MANKKSKLTNDELDAVYNSMEDYIFENHKLCSITEINENTGISKSKCKQILSELIKKQKIKEVYGGGTNPKIYVPTYMMNEILAAQVKPRWVDDYSFDEKVKKIEEITEIKSQIKEYEMFERLVYSTNTPLEEAVAHAFDFLGFDKVDHLNDPERHDVEFEYNKKLYLVEVKGKGKHGNKDDILQLGGWIKIKLNEGMKRDELQGLFVINHYRKDDPNKRGDPLTVKAKEFLKHYDSRFIETIWLYQLIKDVLDKKLSKKDAREKIVKGQKID